MDELYQAMHPDITNSSTSISPDQGLCAEITFSGKDDSISAKSERDTGDIDPNGAETTESEKNKSKNGAGDIEAKDAEQTEDEKNKSKSNAGDER